MKFPPNCRTCKWFDNKWGTPQDAVCHRPDKLAPFFVSGPFEILKPDIFVCSEHETEDGTKWFNWGVERET